MTNKESLPHDDISEIGIVGTVLLHPEYTLKSDYLKPKMFFNRENASVYYVIQQLYNQNITDIDDFSIINQIEGNKSLKKIFDNLNIDNIQEFLEDAKLVGRHNIDEYQLLVNSVMSSAFKRDSYTTLSVLSQECLSDDNKSINEFNMHVQDTVTSMAENYIFDTGLQTIGEKIDEVWNKILSKRQGNGISGIPSKFEYVNNYFTYENGELTVIGGRAKAGKSVIFMNEALHKASQGVPTSVFDTELNDERWIERLISHITGIKIKDVKSGNYDEISEQKIIETIEYIKTLPLYHVYDPSWTKDKIYIKAKMLKIKYGLGFLIYDYIKADSTEDISIKEHNYLGDMTNFLKNKVAGELDIPILAGGQMSPKEQRLADSDKINRYASTIAYWIKKSNEELLADGGSQGTHKLFVDYNRLGKMMSEGEYMNFIFDGDTATIIQAPSPFHDGDEVPF